MKKFTEALKKATGLPAESLKEVEAALAEMVQEAIAQKEAAIKAAFQEQLNAAYEEADAAITEAEAVADAGYQQAYGIILDYAERLEQQSEAYENAQEEGYEQAYAKIEAIEAEAAAAEGKIYEEFNNKLKQMRDLFVEKIHNYLEMSKAEIYSEARRDILNDPRTAEHRVAIEKIAETVSTYLDDENLVNATSNRIEEANKQIEELRSNIRLIEQRNVTLSMKNQRLDEEVRSAKNLLTESTKTERKERAKNAGNVSGRGQRALESERVISEYHNPQVSKNDDSDDSIMESNQVLNDYLFLSGLTQPE
jgi:hypothetical protein